MDTWILAQRAEAVALHRPGEVILVGPRHLFDRVSPRLLITDQGALRHALYPYMRDDANRQKLVSLYQRLAHGNVASWAQSTEQVIDHIAGLVQVGTIAAMAAPEVGPESGMPPASAAQTSGAGLTQASGLVSQWSLSDRFAYVLQHAPDTMAPALHREFSNLLDPTSLAVMAGALALWAASHAVGAGEVIDVVLLAVGYAMAGWAIFDALGYIVECITDTVRAKDIGDLDHAAQSLANATAKLGAGVIIALLTRVAGRVSKQVGGARQARVPETARPVTAQGAAHEVGGGAAAANGVPQITQNAANGAAFEQAGLDYLHGVNSDVASQVSIRPYTETGDLANYRVRLDALGRSDSGDINLYDFKSSETAGFTPNQTTGYPLLKEYGGQVVGGNGGLAYPPGTPIPPTEVQIIRPGGF